MTIFIGLIQLFLFLLLGIRNGNSGVYPSFQSSNNFIFFCSGKCCNELSPNFHWVVPRPLIGQLLPTPSYLLPYLPPPPPPPSPPPFCGYFLWTLFVVLVCEHILWAHFIDTFCGSIMWILFGHFIWTIKVNTFCQCFCKHLYGHFLLTLFFKEKNVDPLCGHLLLTLFVNTFFRHFLWPFLVDTFWCHFL